MKTPARGSKKKKYRLVRNKLTTPGQESTPFEEDNEHTPLGETRGDTNFKETPNGRTPMSTKTPGSRSKLTRYSHALQTPGSQSTPGPTPGATPDHETP